MQQERRIQDTSWWITSIAISVVCCSILFLLFASYLVDIKNTINTNKTELEDLRIISDSQAMRIKLLQKAMMPATAAAAPQADNIVLSPTEESQTPAPSATTSVPAVSAPTLAPPATANTALTTGATAPVSPAVSTPATP